MEWVEVTGRSLDEARERALDQLGVAEEDAEFEILAEPRSGLFGLVRAEARLRARVRPARPRAKEDRRDRARRPARRVPRASKADRGDRGSAATDGDRDSSRRRSSSKRRTKSPSRSNGAAPGREEMAVSELSLEEQAALVQEFLEELVDRLELDAQVDMGRGEDDAIEASVTGPDLGLLIGPGGSTLVAIQELTRTVVQRRSGGRTGRVFVDVAGYKEKRREALSRFARQVVEDVLASGEEEALEPMSAGDRKVVHDTVNAMAGVGTRSEGEEPRRWVVVFPGP